MVIKLLINKEKIVYKKNCLNGGLNTLVPGIAGWDLLRLLTENFRVIRNEYVCIKENTAYEKQVIVDSIPYKYCKVEISIGLTVIVSGCHLM